MIINSEKINDPDLSEEENDIIFKSFIRRLEKERNIEHWEKVLAEKHDLPRPVNLPPRSAIIRKLILPIFGIAAAVLALIIFLPNLMRTDGQDLLAEYQEEALVTSYRSPEDSPASSLRESLTANFYAGDYAAAQAAGQALRDLPGAEARDLLNLGVASLRNADYSTATTTFRQLLASNGELLTEAQYYLGLSLLLQGDTETGLTELRKIKATSGTKFYDKAQALLGANWE